MPRIAKIRLDEPEALELKILGFQRSPELWKNLSYTEFSLAAPSLDCLVLP